MQFFQPIHDLIWWLMPGPIMIRIGPAEILTAIGMTGLIHFEIRTSRRHR